MKRYNSVHVVEAFQISSVVEHPHEDGQSVSLIGSDGDFAWVYPEWVRTQRQTGIELVGAYFVRREYGQSFAMSAREFQKNFREIDGEQITVHVPSIVPKPGQPR